MFNLLKFEKGKVNTKILVMMLVIALTFANFALLGTYLNESIAGGNNPEISAYFGNPNNTTIEKDINDEVTLNVSINIAEGGRLEDAKLDFKNTNFELKNEEKINYKQLGTLQSGTTNVECSVIAIKNPAYKVDLLNMESTILLTGNYIDSNNNSSNISEECKVKIEWNTNSVTDENLALESEIITNTVVKLNEENKRVIQLKINSNVINNVAPVKEECIEIEVPTLNNQKPDVEVFANSLKATNGKEYKDFGNDQIGKYTYNKDEGKLYINAYNKGEKVSWLEDAQDEFIVTYIYNEPEGEKTLSGETKIKAELSLYGKDAKISKEISVPIDIESSVYNTIVVNNSVTPEIYKGEMYIGKETKYETKFDLTIPSTEIAKSAKIELTSPKDSFDAEGIDTLYKTTRINKEQAIDLLGTDGSISVNEDIITFDENTEGKYIEIKYEENVNNIKIETSIPKKAGKLEIINEKTIKVVNSESVATATKMESSITVNGLERSAKASLLEPQTVIETSINPTSISNQSTADLTIESIFKSSENKYKLFDNPTIKIELPSEIKDLSIENRRLESTNLAIKTLEIKDGENGNKVIEITTEGKQEGYVTLNEEPVLVLGLKINNIEKYMTNKNTSIKMIYTNGEETFDETFDLKIKSLNGFVTKSTLKVNETEISNQDKLGGTVTTNENDKVRMDGHILNNYGKTVNNFQALIAMPSDNDGKFTANMNSLSVENQNAKVYYSLDANFENWQEAQEEFDITKATAAKITIDSFGIGEEMPFNVEFAGSGRIDIVLSGEELTNTKYSLEIKENNTEVVTQTNAQGPAETAEPQAPEQGEQEIVKDGKVSIDIQASILGEDISSKDEVNNKQAISFKVTVKNEGENAIKNLKALSKFENAILFDLVHVGENVGDGEKQYKYAQVLNGEYMTVEELEEKGEEYADKYLEAKEYDLGQLEAGKKKIFEYILIANKQDIINGNKLINTIEVAGDNLEKTTGTYEKRIKDVPVGLRLETKHSENIKLTTDDDFGIVLYVQNLENKKLNNVKVNLVLSSELTLSEDEIKEINSIDGITCTFNNNEAVITIAELSEEGETLIIQLTAKKQDQEIVKRDVSVYAKVSVNGGNEENTSNKYETSIYQGNTILNTTFTSDSQGKVLQAGDDITYTLLIENVGKIDYKTTITADIPDALQIDGIELETKQSKQEESLSNTNAVYLTETIKANDYLKITIEASVVTVKNDKATFFMTVDGKETSKISNTIAKLEEKETEYEKEEDENNEQGNENNNEGTYSISGLAWLDENENGMRDSSEEILRDIIVGLVNEKGELAEKTKTSISGTYKFNNLLPGKYIVVFVYDNDIYTLTKYKADKASDYNNSDAMEKTVEVDGEKEKIAATSVLQIEDADIENIDIGLIQSLNFDLKLDKYITKVTVTNSYGITTYDYSDGTNLAKIEIGAKKFVGSVVAIEYSIVITNQGTIEGYIDDITDYMPKDLEFNTSMNEDWYLGNDGAIHYIQEDLEEIEPGDTQTVKLILTKTLSSNSAGTIENTAEIGESVNLEDIPDRDSTAGNKKAGEDDISKAELIISIKTGGTPMYVGIIIASIAVMGLSIYLINKKVLKNGMEV